LGNDRSLAARWSAVGTVDDVYLSVSEAQDIARGKHSFRNQWAFI
jgi:hypothetical protein